MFKNDSVGDSRNGFSFIKAYFGEHCPGRHEQDTFPLAGNDARQDKRSQHGGGAAAAASAGMRILWFVIKDQKSAVMMDGTDGKTLFPEQIK